MILVWFVHRGRAIPGPGPPVLVTVHVLLLYCCCVVVVLLLLLCCCCAGGGQVRTGGRAGVRVLSLRHHTASRLNILHTPSDQLQSPGTASRDADGIFRQNRAQAEMHHTMTSFSQLRRSNDVEKNFHEEIYINHHIHISNDMIHLIQATTSGAPLSIPAADHHSGLITQHTAQTRITYLHTAPSHSAIIFSFLHLT